MKTRSLMTLAAATGAALSACADAVPEVSGVTLSQGDTSRLATIAYTLKDAPAVITLDIQTNATDGTWASIGGENIQNLRGDVWRLVQPGDHQILWRPDRSWPDHKIAEGGARAVVTAWSADNPPDYLVVNLAANAATNYYPSVEFLPGGLLANPDYRTSRLVLRKVAAGGVTWTMGSDPTETGRDAASEGAHDVTLANHYYIGVFPVTQTQWSYVQTERPTPSVYRVEGGMRPVETVSYNEIRNAANGTTADTSYDWPKDPNPGSFLGLLRKKTGLAFDLPSEAQWEFACRAGLGSGVWNDGSRIREANGSDANLNRLGRNHFNGGSVQTINADGSVSYGWPSGSVGPENATAIVGSYVPNAWGLYDMHGNVAEWCLDWYEDDITKHGGAVNVDTSNPANTLSGTAGSERVLRSAFCSTKPPKMMRAAARDKADPSARYSNNGFRLVLELTK